MDNNRVESVLNETLSKLKSIVDVDCIIGQPVLCGNGETVIPISKATIGFVSGGGEYNKPQKKRDFPFAGGSGAGCTITPIGFLVIKKDSVEYINANDEGTFKKIYDIANKILENIKKG